jgi:hypothetical protein
LLFKLAGSHLIATVNIYHRLVHPSSMPISLHLNLTFLLGLVSRQRHGVHALQASLSLLNTPFLSFDLICLM